MIAELKEDESRSWKLIRDYFVTQGVTRHLNKVLAQLQAADPNQSKLPGMASTPLEGLESMPLLVTAEGAAVISRQLVYERYHTEVTRLERRINSYGNKRRKPENLAADIERLKQMKAFDPRFAQYSAEDPDLPLWKAKELEAKESKHEPGRPERKSKPKKG